MISINHFIILVCLAVLLVSAPSVSSQTANVSTTAQEADALYKAQKWPESTKAYEALVKVEPLNAAAWLRLGISLHFSGRYEEAIQAALRAVEITNSPIGMYNIASAYARLNNKDKAIEWLNKALSQGFPQPGNIMKDEDFAGLREEPRFKEIVSLVERKMKPCLFDPQYKQFDFWVGEWQVQHSQTGQSVGASSVQSIIEGCVVFENWVGAGGGTGKSFNFYNSRSGKWQQVWVSSGGSVLEYSGEYKDGAMRYEALGPERNGVRVLFRLTFFNLGPERVRQLSEQSVDGGKTWTVQYDFTYLRKNSK